ncbi:MAG: helix-turn-helix transcriptional regulator [Clostridiales bacterium]|nr:helix-turn-helix transcriptional regulator [Clostridiales bacterium]
MLPENYYVDRVEELLKQRGWTRYQLAQRSGIAQSSVTTLLNRKNVPTFQTLNKICDGFGITMAQFFAPGKRLDLTDEQEQLLGSWDAMDDRDKELVKAYIQGITKQ